MEHGQGPAGPLPCLIPPPPPPILGGVNQPTVEVRLPDTPPILGGVSLPTAEVRLVKPTTGGSVGLPDTPPPPILGGVCQPTAEVRLIILAARGSSSPAAWLLETDH